MLRVLTLSTLFPDATRPTFGVFVERQTRALADLPGVELKVVAPIGAPPGLARHPRYRAAAGLPAREDWRGLDVLRPRFPTLPGPAAWLNPRLLASTLLPLLRAVQRDFAFDVIDAQFFFPDGPAAARLGRALGVPVSIKARGADIHYWPERLGCAREIIVAGHGANGMLAVSAALRADMIALGLSGDLIRVHYTGVDLDRFHPRARQAPDEAGPLLLSVGHLIPRKGHAIAIDAAARIAGARLWIVGDGPDRAALSAQISRLGVADRVRLLGALPHEQLPALLAAADLLVLASASEGLANVWVEALACGTPVVTTDVGGAREIIDRPAAGRLVARNAEAFAAAIADLLATPPDTAATRAAAERFTWAANAAALRDHLTEIVRNDRPRSRA